MFQSIDTLAYAVQTFVENCVSGITANETRCRYLVENSVGVITAICPMSVIRKQPILQNRPSRPANLSVI